MSDYREIPRPSILATLLWCWGVFILGATGYIQIVWRGWTQNLNDFLLVIIGFTGAVNAIATGAPIERALIEHSF